MRTLFVAGSHTDVGKTFAACALITAAKGRGLTVGALKPLVSGFDPYDWRRSDPGLLLAAQGKAPSAFALERISPWRFEAPLAPPMAARLEGRAIDFGAVVAWCRTSMAEARQDFMLVEGVGGVMSPITEGHTGLDLAAALAGPSLLVGGTYLGAISHTLTAVVALKAHGAPPSAVVVSQGAGDDAPDFAETVATVVRFLPDVPVVAAPRDGDMAWAEAVLDIVLAGVPGEPDAARS
jgi:dethiobiotin synthetase